MHHSSYRLFEKLNIGKTGVNIFLRIPNAWTAEMMSCLDVDAVTLDLQHGLISFDSMVAMLQAMQKDKFPMARLKWNDPAHIMQVLDAGVKGVICPMINSKKEAEAFISACFYPPMGMRSYGPTRANLPPRPTYLKDYHHDIRTFVQIETKEGLENVDAIASAKNLSGLYLGPYDLSIDLGFEKVADFSDPAFMKHVHRVLEAAKKFKLIAAVHALHEEHALMLAGMGFNLVTPLDDSGILVQGAKDKLGRITAGILDFTGR
jgi:4-hydroxy-2-oxoheptanedioate aldolase